MANKRLENIDTLEVPGSDKLEGGLSFKVDKNIHEAGDRPVDSHAVKSPELLKVDGVSAEALEAAKESLEGVGAGGNLVTRETLQKLGVKEGMTATEKIAAMIGSDAKLEPYELNDALYQDGSPIDEEDVDTVN